MRGVFTDSISQVVLRTGCWCLVSNYQPSKPGGNSRRKSWCSSCVWSVIVIFNSRSIADSGEKSKSWHIQRDMSGIGRPRTSSFAEPPGVPGTAAATAGSAAVLVSSTGKSGVPQASGGSSSGCSNVKLARKLCLSVFDSFYLLTYKQQRCWINLRKSLLLTSILTCYSILVGMLMVAIDFGCTRSLHLIDVFNFTDYQFSCSLARIFFFLMK